MTAALIALLASAAISGDRNVPLSVSKSGVDVHLEPRKKNPNAVGVKTQARSVFVADLATGKILYAKNSHEKLPIASMTKLVTAMIFLDQKPKMTDTITFDASDFDGEGKAVFAPGETITNADALNAMLIGSVNAAANAIARTAGKEIFVRKMNEKVASLHLRSPIFFEPSGVNPQNQASAADLASILSTAMGYPDIQAAAHQSSIVISGLATKKTYKIDSTNLLLSSYLNKEPYKILVAKTGSLPEAGYCMGQVTQSSDGHSVIAIELGSANHFSRYQDVKNLTAWAFHAFEWGR